MDSKEEVQYVYKEHGIEEVVDGYVSNAHATDIILEHIRKLEDSNERLLEALTLALEALEDTNNMNEKYHKAQEIAGE